MSERQTPKPRNTFEPSPEVRKKKRVLLVVAIIFTLTMLYLGYDIMSRTTRPGQKKQLPERILNN